MIRIGYLAKKIFLEGGTASVLGKTSQGIYLSTPSRWVVFCSWERFCSPLTMNVDGKGRELERVAVGMGAQLEANQLSIPEAGFVLRLEENLEWIPGEPLEQPSAIADCVERLDSLWRTVQSLKGSGVDIPEERNLGKQVGDRVEEALSQHLGAGQGLTPSGDDFVTGYLLAVNRYKPSFWLQGDLESLNRQVVAAAYQKTTRLSANLIEMATWGESDERLLNALDYVLGADYDLEEIAVHLSGWGHSSGVAGLGGMAAAILTGRCDEEVIP
ncbi:MAG: DUF2877 domain-containing protein [Anaerolineales bacterium]|nr:DUF2877 domain-containing protein [Anaerolineales bacterium]